MANPIKTVMTYQLDGTTKDFNIPFEYLARKFVVITLIGATRQELVITTDYRFTTKTTITTSKAWGPADGFQLIEVRRFTSATDRLVDFADGSILRAYDLNVAQVQTLHVAEEARDLTADTIGVNNDGNLDARGRRIVNIADGIDPGDAITMNQITGWNDSALNSAQAAKASELAAKASEGNAKTSETNSKTSENNSKASENNSKLSENKAKDWATKAKGVIVDSGLYSAFHWSQIAGDYAATTLTYRDAAAQSASSAATSAATATTEAAKLADFNDIVDRLNGVAVAEVGEVSWHHFRAKMKTGCVAADGQTLSRLMFPVLWQMVNTGMVPVVTEAAWLNDPTLRNCYTTGDGTGTFRVPDLNGAQAGSISAPVLRGDAGGTISGIQRNGVPNVISWIDIRNTWLSGTQYNPLVGFGGAVVNESPDGTANVPISLATGASTTRFQRVTFDNKKVSGVYQDNLAEARMNSAVGCWVIRAFGVVYNPGAVDAAAIATRVEQIKLELDSKLALAGWLPITDPLISPYLRVGAGIQAPPEGDIMALYDPIRSEFCVKGVFRPNNPFSSNTTATLVVVEALPGSYTNAQCHYGGQCIFQTQLSGGGRASGYFRSIPGATLPIPIAIEGGAPANSAWAIVDMTIRLF